jgi:outer membrane lipoprotein SlyB
MNKTITKNMSKAMAVMAAIGLFTSCAREISGDVYNASHVGEASTTHSGVIVHARNVTVEGSENLQDNGLGIIGGGAAGALAGSQFGKGDGNTLATIGGAIAGATAGAFAEKALKKQQGTEYIVQLDNGQTMTVVQGPNPAFSVGQSVYVVIGHKGRSRVVAR